MYAIFGSKAGLLGELLTALEADAGAEAWRQRIHGADDPAARIGAFAAWDAHLYRTGLGLVRAAHRAGGDDVDALHAAGNQRRRDALAALVTSLGPTLRAGLDVDGAVDRAFALTAPAVYLDCVDSCGWTDEDYRRWLTGLLVTDLLG